MKGSTLAGAGGLAGLALAAAKTLGKSGAATSLLSGLLSGGKAGGGRGGTGKGQGGGGMGKGQGGRGGASGSGRGSSAGRSGDGDLSQNILKALQSLADSKTQRASHDEDRGGIQERALPAEQAPETGKTVEANRHEAEALALLERCIVSNIPGRVRVRHPGLTVEDAFAPLEKLLLAKGIDAVKFSARTGSALLSYDADRLDFPGFLLAVLPLASFLLDCERALHAAGHAE